MKTEIKEQADQIIGTLPEFARSFFRELRAQRKSEKTVLQYSYDLHGFFSWLKKQAGYKDMNIMSSPASEVLDHLTIDDIHEYSETLQYHRDSSGDLCETSDSYLARKMSSLRSFFRYYNLTGLSKSNLYALISIPKVSKKEISVLDQGEVDRLMAAIDDTENMSEEDKIRYEKHRLRDKAMVKVLFGTGIRVSELVGLNIGDIDIKNASMTVTLKGGNEDTSYFPSFVEEAIVEYYEQGRPLLVQKDSEKAFFLSNRGTRLSVRSVEILMEKLKMKTGIAKKVTPHSCRRVYGTRVYEETNDIGLTATALHHSSMQTTADHYAKQSEEHKRKAAAAAATLMEEK